MPNSVTLTTQVKRIPSKPYPQKSGNILSQWLTIHRPQPPRKARPFGVRSSFTSQPPWRTDTASLGSDGRSLPRLERAQDVRPSVRGPASTGADRECHRDMGPNLTPKGLDSEGDAQRRERVAPVENREHLNGKVADGAPKRRTVGGRHL